MKSKRSKLDPHSDRLEEWFGVERITIEQARQRLSSQFGCSVSAGRLSGWWQDRQQERMQEELLNRIASGAELNRQIEDKFAKDAPPELATLVGLLQSLVLQLSVHGLSDPKLLGLASGLMKPVMAYYQLQQTRQEFELSRDRFQRETCELFVRWAEDQRAQEVLRSSGSNSEKISVLGPMMFGELWKG